MLKLLVAMFSVVTLFSESRSFASVALPPGSGPLALPGSSVSIEEDLGGTVVYDKLVPFTIYNAAHAPLFYGRLQNRVVKSTKTGTFHFYYRIRDTKAGLNGIVGAADITSYQNFAELLVDWRPDGLGSIAPLTAQRTAAPGSTIRFMFPTDAAVPLLVGGKESKFFFVKTSAKKYSANGRMVIHLTTGQTATVRTVIPLQ